MHSDRIMQALSRLEAATQRIDSAAGEIARGHSTPDTDPALAQRHAALRKETSIAMAELDALLGSLDG